MSPATIVPALTRPLTDAARTCVPVETRLETSMLESVVSMRTDLRTTGKGRNLAVEQSPGIARSAVSPLLAPPLAHVA